MKIKPFYREGELIIGLEGELDHHAAKETVQSIEESIDANLPKRLILDFERLAFMDSSGIAVILKSFRRMNELDGELCVENVHKQPLRVLDAAGLGRLVKIMASSKDASG